MSECDWSSDVCSSDLVHAGLLTGISNHNLTYRLEPTRTITRGEVVSLIDRAFPGIVMSSGAHEGVAKGNVVVAAADVTLTKGKIDGGLVLAEGIGDGDVTLDSLTVAGTTVVRGGGSETVYFMG